MEALQKLQQIQKIIDLMHSSGFFNNDDNNSQCHRFLANFTLFLLQPCEGLNFTRKIQLISEYMPKISDSFLTEAQHRVDNEEREGAIPFLCGEKVVSQPQKTTFEEFSMIGLDAMQRANSTLEDFCRSYFMFHKMDPNDPQSLFRYHPVLSFTESYIYQLDTLNEKLLQSPTDENHILCREINMESNISWIHKWTSILINDSFGPLIVLLEKSGLLTERIREELDFGKEYWALERKLCGALMNNEEVLVGDVTRAMHLKSFDYRVLNLILYQLREEEICFFEAVLKVNELHMEFLSISEFLVEVSDDMFDYEEDVLENSFNILRMFMRLYGTSLAPAKLATCISEAEEKYNRLLKALDPELSKNYQRRCEEATREGGKKSGPPLGTWSIPPLIENEDLYRAEAAAHHNYSFSCTNEKRNDCE